MANDQDNSPKPKKKRLRYLISLACLVVVSGAIFVFIHIISKPIQANVTASQKVISSPIVYSIDLSPVIQAGKYASFNRPKALNLVSSAPANPASSLESYKYFVKDIYSWTLSIDVSTSSTGVTGLSSYMIRAGNPTNYLLARATINNQSVSIFTDTSFTSGFSETGFFSGNNKVATVSLIGNDPSGLGPLNKTFNMVIGTWQWH